MFSRICNSVIFLRIVSRMCVYINLKNIYLKRRPVSYVLTCERVCCCCCFARVTFMTLEKFFSIYRVYCFIHMYTHT